MANIGLTMVPWATCNLPSSHPPERSATSANYISEDMQTWQYLGEQWHANHVWRPRAWSVSIKHILASTISPSSISAPERENYHFFVGIVDDNGSTFQPSAATAGGVQQDWGRQLCWGHCAGTGQPQPFLDLGAGWRIQLGQAQPSRLP